MKIRFSALSLFLLIAALLLTSPDRTEAAEGGGSRYLQGTYGDFGMAMIGPAGFYYRNDLVFADGDIAAVSRGNFILSGLEQTTLVNAFKFNYTSNWEIFGGRFGAVLGIPLVLDADVSGSIISPIAESRDGSRSGLADPYFVGFLGWNPAEDHHLMAAFNVYTPWGDYDADRIINLGRNYWVFNPTLAYTWLDSDRGHEFSMTTGLMFNTENPDTNYETGTEFHFDFMLAQHFPNNLTIGLNGYYYSQVSDDKGEIVGAIPVGDSGFRSLGYGLGPALSWRPTIGDTQVTFIAKWLHDFEATRRVDGDVVVLSAALKF